MQEQRHEDRDRAASAFPCSSKQDAERIGGLRRFKRRVWAIRGYLHFLYGLLTSYLYDIGRYHRAASKGNEAVRAGKSRHTELRSWIAADAHKI
ncbi:MAG: DUF4765 family protein, partial [Candidatus Hydrogenedentes bacterium]|nr:DUF4765 family protein [Candidatus Hydrogenedentota bacterium]